METNTAFASGIQLNFNERIVIYRRAQKCCHQSIGTESVGQSPTRASQYVFFLQGDHYSQAKENSVVAF